MIFTEMEEQIKLHNEKLVQIMKSVNFVCHTNGRGYWSREQRQVQILGLAVNDYTDEDEPEELYGELRVYFNTKSWDVAKHGLIYTDRQFESELKRELFAMGFKVEDVDYSEQGMQGNDYVSLDVGKQFMDSWKTKGLEYA